MFRRRDVLLIAVLLALAAALYGVTALSRAGRAPTGEVAVYLDGELYATIPLGEACDVEIRGENGAVNVVHVDANGARMASSTCKNQLCIAQGEVTTANYAARVLGTRLICLPNRVVVELVTQSGDANPNEDLADI